MHHAQHRPPGTLQPDQRPPHRQAGDEGPRPVDRIEHPDVFGVEPFATEFLAENAVVGVTFGQQPPHRLLRRPVGHRHRIERPAGELVLHRHSRSEMRQDRRSRHRRHLVEKGDEIRAHALAIRHRPPRCSIASREPCPRPSPLASPDEPAPPRTARRRPPPIALQRKKSLDFAAAQYIFCCIAVGCPQRTAGPSRAFPP